MSNFYCAAPWRGLHINPRGDVKTCCAGDPNMLGNLNSQSIEQILHGPVMQEIRQSIRQGQPHAYCYNCVQAERYGRSERDWHNNVSPEFDPATADDIEHRPTLIDVRWNTTCNLSCNYCAEACSSKWAALKGIPTKSGARPYYEAVCDYLEQHRHNIREVALVGGEPLLLPENDRLLDVIPEDCVVTLITNVAVDFSTNRIVKKLLARHRVGWSLSFDNIGERFEYVRHGADWQQLLSNLNTLRPLMQSNRHWGGIHAVYNIYNATRLIELTEFARSQGLTIHWQSLYQPDCLDPQRLGNQIKQLALQEIDRLLALDICLDSERMFFQTVKSNIQAARDDLRTEFATHIQDIENKYHPDTAGKFRQLWPELCKVINVFNEISVAYQDEVAGKTFDWLGEDNPKNFQRHCNDPAKRQLLEQAGWLDQKVTYQFNRQGFRSAEFDGSSDYFVAVGCSFTFGTAIQTQQRYTDIVANQLNLTCYNLGIQGGSDDTSVRLLLTWLDQLNPKFVIYQNTFPQRFEVVNNNTATIYGIHSTLGGSVAKDNGTLYKHLLTTPSNEQIRACKNQLAVRELCRNKNIKLIEISYIDFLKTHDNSARDLHHPGAVANQSVAQMILHGL